MNSVQFFALNYVWSHHNCKYQSMPTLKCKAKQVMALGKHTFSHMVVMVTEYAFCMHSGMNVMTAFTAEFSSDKNVAVLPGLS